MNKKLKVMSAFCVIFTLIFLLSPNTYAAKNSEKKKDKTSPTAPSNLSAVMIDQNSVTLSWTASYDANGVASYLIYMDSSNIAETQTTVYTVSGLTTSTTYKYYIRAKDNSGNISPISTTISVTTLALTPENPTPPQEIPSSKIIAGYYASWSAYSGYTPLSIPASNMTHINYAFAKIGNDLKITLGDPYIDIDNIAKLNQLKASNSNLKTLISIGGWTFSDKFSDASLTESSRTIFADSVIDFIKQYNFDGVDIDWEYPVSGGLSTNVHRTEDKTNFTLLMKVLRERLDAQGATDGREYLLSFSGGSGSTYISNVELSTLSGIVDYAILMTYDLHGPWDSYTDFNSALYSPSEFSPQYKISVDSCVKSCNTAGFPSSKIVLGVPFYGYIYSGVASDNNGLYKTYTSGKSITYDNVISSYLNNSTYKKYYHSEAKVPYLFNGSVFISYDDTTSVLEKADYVNDNNLAGVSAWELSQNKDGTLINVLYSNLK